MSRCPEPSSLRTSRLVACSLALTALVVLTGCSEGVAPPPAAPSSETTETTATTSPTSVPTEASQPVLEPDGSADDNLPLFTAVVAQVWGSPESVAGRAYIDALVAAGFDKAAMQVTHDETTVGNPAESIQFSVRWGEQCMIGQVGPATGEPYAAVVPVLAEGTCLVGGTRPIDW